ncbi:GNAT family N-acetyltransferase [Nostoc sp.]|uniref:GNAT family N-acetyltransferase n=1 Tax=Nostoc sp. TaxID=1180 RepID=UPI002FF4F157
MKIPITYQIKTERCILRCVSSQDIPYVFSATQFPGFNDGMPWEPPEFIEELHEHLQQSLQAWESHSAYTFTIKCASTSRFIGRISIRKNHELARIWNLAFWTHPEHQSQGYMTEVAQAIIKFGFTVLAADRIEAYHALWNRSSEKVLKKLGCNFFAIFQRVFRSVTSGWR